MEQDEKDGLVDDKAREKRMRMQLSIQNAGA